MFRCRAYPVLVLFLLLPCVVTAGVGDPTLATNHPDYPGEGAFQTVEQCVQFATTGKTTVQDRAISLYLWMLTHQFHLPSPQEWNVPGKTPNTQKADNDLLVQDAERARFSYGYGLCGTVHAWNEVYWRALGLRARCRAFPGHTNSEIEYDNAWHAFDTDMAGLVFRRDGVVAGYEDLIKDPTLIDVNRAPLPRYPFAWPGDFNAMKAGWKQVAQGGNWFKMYNTSYVGQPGIVALRAGESFTRTFDPDHFGGPDQRRFWHIQKGGPFRDWTFVNQGTPIHDGPKSNSRGNARYCNGEFIYRPDLTSARYREGVVEETTNVIAEKGLRSKDGSKASVTFEHHSPYVIAGRPVDGINPMTASATGGLVITGQATGPVMLSVSADLGQTWHEVGPLNGPFSKDCTDLVKGRYGWRVRFQWQGQAGLDSLNFATVTQVAQTIYPRLRPGGTTVTYRSAARAVVPVLPNFGTDEEALARFEEKSLRSPNVTFVGQGPNSRIAYRVTDNKPGSIVFRVDSPTDLVALRAAARFTVRVPPPEKCDYRLDVSTDEGRTWQPLGKADIPRDNEFSSGWMYGQTDLTAAGRRSALVRVTLYQGGYTVGLLAAELYGIRATPPAQETSITYTWKEAGTTKSHTETIPAGTRERTWTVPTGNPVEDVSVRMEVK